MTTDNKTTSQSPSPEAPKKEDDNVSEEKNKKAKARKRRIVKVVIAIIAFQAFFAILLIACILVPMLPHSRQQEATPSIVALPFDTESVVKQVLALPWSWYLESSADGVESRLELQLEELEKAYPSSQSVLARINGHFLRTAEGADHETPASVLLRLSLVLDGNYVCVGQPTLESISPAGKDDNASECAPLSVHFNQIAASLDDHIRECKIGVPVGTANIHGIDKEHIFLTVNQLNSHN